MPSAGGKLPLCKGRCRATARRRDCHPVCGRDSPKSLWKGGDDQLFSLPKRKKLAKKKLATLQVDRLAPINWPATAKQASLDFFCFQRCGASDGGFTYVRSQEVGSRRFTNGRFRFDGRGAHPTSSREPRNTNRMGLRSTIRGDRDRADAGVRRRDSISPTWGFLPAVCRRTDSDSFPVRRRNQHRTVHLRSDLNFRPVE